MIVHAIIPGSFDPVTAGHYDLFASAGKMCGKVTVLLSCNGAKNAMFDKEIRMNMLRQATAGLDNVCVDAYEGLVGEYCSKNNIDVIIKGVRNARDYEYEQEMAGVNAILSPDTRTIFLPAAEKFRLISSSMLRIFIEGGRDVSEYLPKGVTIEK